MLGWKPKPRQAPVEQRGLDAELVAAASQVGIAVSSGKPEGLAALPIADLDAMREKNRRRILDIARRDGGLQMPLAGEAG